MRAILLIVVFAAGLHAQITAGGDLSGTLPAPTVAKIRGRTVDPGAPSQGYVYVWDNVLSKWVASLLPASSVAPGTNGYCFLTTAGVSGWAACPGGAVSSVFGRTGAVTPQAGDYSAYYPQLSGSYVNPAWTKFQATGTGSVARTVSDKLGDTVSVEDYGAKCDGSTDDSAAFVTAFSRSRRVNLTAGKVCVVKDVVIPTTAPTDGTYPGFTFDGHGAYLKAGTGASWAIKFTDAGTTGASWPAGNHRVIKDLGFIGTATDMMILEGGCYWDNQIERITSNGTATNLIKFVQSEASPCQPGAVRITDVTSYANITNTLYFYTERSTGSALNLFDDFRISGVFNYSAATDSAAITANANVYMSNSSIQGVVKVGSGHAIKWNAGNTYMVNSRISDVYSESSQATGVGFIGYATKTQFSNVRRIISTAAAMPNASAINVGFSQDVTIASPSVTDNTGATLGQDSPYPVVVVGASTGNVGVMGIAPAYLDNSLTIDAGATNVWTPTRVIKGALAAPRVVAGTSTDDGATALQGSSGKITGCCFYIDSSSWGILGFQRSGVLKWTVGNNGNNDFTIGDGSNDWLTIDHTSHAINTGGRIKQGTLNTPAVTTGTAAPATTPAAIGDIYVDTSGAKTYIAKGTASSADWVVSQDGGGSGGGDASTNTSTSVDGEVALFSGTGGKTLKRATGSGVAKIASGVLGTATAGTDYAAPTNGTNGQVLTSNGSGGFGTPVTLGGAATLNVGTTAGTVAAGNDSRLSDARTPTAHAASHGSGQADAVTIATSQVTGLETALSGKQATISGAPGTWPSTFTPTTHASAHTNGGGDAVSLDAAQITSGTLAAARIPAPTASTLGGVNSTTCSVGQYVSAITTAGAITCGTPAGGGSSSPFPSGRVSYTIARGDTSWTQLGETVITTNGTATSAVASDTAPASITYTSGTAQNSSAYINGNGQHRSQTQLRWKAWAQLPAASDYTAGTRVWLAMSDSGGLASNNDSPTATYFGFRASGVAGDTNWKCAHAAAGSQNIADSGVAVDTTGHIFEAFYDYANSQVLYYIDNTQVCSGISQTNRPASGIALRMNMATFLTDTSAVAKAIKIGWFYTAASR